MGLLNSVFGTNPVVGQTMATNNAAQNAVLIGNPSASLLTKVRSKEAHFTVVQAHNGYIVSTRDYDNDTQQRYIASTMQEVKDLVASILVQNKLSEP